MQLCNYYGYRDIHWLLEPHYVDYNLWKKSSCNVALMLDVSQDMYIDPDQIHDLQRLKKVKLEKYFMRL